MNEPTSPSASGAPPENEELTQFLYQQLRATAAREIQRVGPHTVIDPTGLVHDVWIRMSDAEGAWKDRDHFLSFAARAMRNLLIDSARKRGVRPRRELPGGASQVDHVLEKAGGSSESELNPIDLEGALVQFERVDPEAARVVELRYFAGATAEEAARLAGLAPRTADRRYDYAMRWLKRRLQQMETE